MDQPNKRDQPNNRKLWTVVAFIAVAVVLGSAYAQQAAASAATAARQVELHAGRYH